MASVQARERAAAAGDTDALNRLRNRRPAEVTVALATDDDLVQAWEAAKVATFSGRMAKDPATKAAADEELAAARADLEAVGLVLWTLRNKGREAYDEVVHANQPGDAEREEAKAKGNQLAWSAKTFPAALIEMSTVGPLEGITAAEINEMLADGRLSEGELGTLFGKALDLYMGTRIPNLGK